MFIHFEIMQVHCTAKTHHQADGKQQKRERERAGDELALHGEEEEWVMFRGHPEVIQSNRSRCPQCAAKGVCGLFKAVLAEMSRFEIWV